MIEIPGGRGPTNFSSHRGDKMLRPLLLSSLRRRLTSTITYWTWSCYFVVIINTVCLCACVKQRVS